MKLEQKNVKLKKSRQIAIGNRGVVERGFVYKIKTSKAN